MSDGGVGRPMLMKIELLSRLRELLYRHPLPWLCVDLSSGQEIWDANDDRVVLDPPSEDAEILVELVNVLFRGYDSSELVPA